MRGAGIVALALALAGTAGCMKIGSPGGDFGATQGGVQDMGLAREMIAAGFVPPADAFVVEGMFSEHDLGVEGPPCTTLLCLRGAAGIAPDADGVDQGWLQVGMSSTVDPDAFVRPSQTIVAVVDVSGSMGWTYDTVSADYVSPGQISRHLLQSIADQLGPQDHLAIVAFGSSVRTALDFTAGDSDRVDAAIADLHEAGSTNMEAGLKRGYRLARDADFGTDEKRVMLFTDAQPNVGLTASTDFQRIADEGASDGIGLTAFAMGVGMGQDVILGMSHLRGGNAFSLFNEDDADALMADSWPWMVSPIAYDLHVDVTPGDGFAVGDAYGFPAPADGASTSSLDVSTVFLSRRKGAMLLELTPDEATPVDTLAAHGTIAYTTGDGAPVTQTLDVGYDGEARDGAWFAQPGVARTLALALLVDGMKDAAALYPTDPTGAIAKMTAVDARFAADATAIGDADLAAEVDLSHALLALMQTGAQQADLYGWGQ